MTSPVDTSVKWFTSKMLGAPVLRGQAGSLIAILDACLVNGWGVQVADTCAVASGICTMTFPLDHAAPVDAVVLVAGASIAALNGEQKVTAVAPNVIQFATAAADGTATGTITAKMAPAGWNKPFTGTNLAVYKSADVAANGHFVRVNDTNALYARAVAYETMTAISRGTGIVPTSTQLSGGQYWHKSAIANAAPIDWYFAADSRMFYFGCASYQSNDIIGNAGGAYAAYVSGPFFGFGDPIPMCRAGDPFSTLILGSGDSTNTYTGFLGFKVGYVGMSYMMRALSGTGTAVGVDCANTSGNQAEDPVCDAASGSVRIAGVIARTTSTVSKRAMVPGVYTGESQYMETVIPNLSAFKAGTPERSYLAALSFEYMGAATGLKLLALDIAGPWR